MGFDYFLGIINLVIVGAILCLNIRSWFYSKTNQNAQQEITEIVSEGLRYIEGLKSKLSSNSVSQRRVMEKLSKVLENQTVMHTMAKTENKNRNDNTQNIHVNNGDKAKELEEAFLKHMAEERRKMQEELNILRRENRRLNSLQAKNNSSNAN